jgi:hypothetical protein
VIRGERPGVDGECPRLRDSGKMGYEILAIGVTLETGLV